MSNNAITGAAHPLQFIEVVAGMRNVVNLEMSPLTDRDISELDLWVQTRYIRMARAAAADIPQDQQEREIEVAQRTAAGLTAFSGSGANMIATVDGMARVVWQSIRARHHDVTEERIKKLLFNPDNLAEANARFKAANIADAPIEKKARTPLTERQRKALRRRVRG